MYLNKEIKIYASRVIDYEIDNISDGNKKRQIEDLYDGLELEKIPYMLVVGKKELEENKVSVRSHKDGDIGAILVKDFESKILKEIEEKV